MELKFKKLHPDAIIPTKAHDTDAGFDLYVPGNDWLVVSSSGIARITTSVAVDIPEGYFGLICGRSSLAAKGIDVLGGVVDAGYHGELIVVVASFTAGHTICEGDKIAQLVILPLPSFTAVEVDEFDTVTERGTKGFGSSGR